MSQDDGEVEMSPNRRDALKGIGGAAAVAAFGVLDTRRARPSIDAVMAALPQDGPSASGATHPAAGTGQAPALPRKADFDIADGYTYINAAYTHPMPRVATEAVRRYAESRRTLRAPEPGAPPRPDPKAMFAELINARATEIAYVPNTSTGENLVVNGLGLDRDFGANVVTDGLHFEGALAHLLELKRQGLDVRVVRPSKELRIDIADLERAIDRNTKLVEVSSVAMYNGFEHDLEAVCDLAHSRGAYVYADIIHSAGAGPFDVKASGVDFAACSSFKWLMGDFGLGFLYAREDLLERVIRRSQVGYYQSADMTPYYPPFEEWKAGAPVSWEYRKDATGSFEVGTMGGAIAAGLAASLQYIKWLGVANIKAHRQPMLAKLRAEVPRFGFTPVTPGDSTSALITFAKRDLAASGLPERLQAAGVNVRLSTHWMRLSPSVYNDMKDIDRFLEALA